MERRIQLARKRDEDLPPQVLGTNDTLCGQAMTERQEGGERLPGKERLHLDLCMILRVVEDPELQLVRAETAHLIEGAQVSHVYLEVGDPLLQALQQPLHQLEGKLEAAADSNRRADPAGPARLCHGALDLDENLPRLLGEDDAGLGWCHLPTGAVKQLHGESVLELADRLREGGLRDVQSLRSTSEVELLDYREVVTEVP
jgi:hypothetical protein